MSMNAYATTKGKDTNEHGFRGELALLNEYLSEQISPRWGGLTGRALKAHLKQGARAAADEFTRSPKRLGNRQHLKICLEGSGVPDAVAYDIAYES